MAQTVIGMFESSSKAEEAVQELVEAGFTRDRIDVSRSSNAGSSYSSSGSSGTSYSDSSDEHESGISRFFKSLFGNDDDDADKYSRVASQSQSIVTVHAQSQDEAERAADILDDNGAVDVDEQATRMGYGNSDSYSNAGTGAGLGAAGLAADTGVTGMGNTGSTDYTNTNRTNFENTGTTGYSGSDMREDTTDETRKIPIIEENLEVGKREVKTGGVRLRSRIIERPVEESIRLREERVNVERNTVDRPATEADLSNFQERNIEMVERAEVPVVNKEARVVEEVSLGKDVEERTETVQDTVRRTEVDVENLEKNDLTRNNRSGNSDL